MDCDVKVGDLERIKDEYLQDKDIIQFKLFSKDKQVLGREFSCPGSLDSELLPPSRRWWPAAAVSPGKRCIWEDRTGLHYYPFHR